LALARLASHLRAKIDYLSFSSLDDVTLPSVQAQCTLFVSRLSDIRIKSMEKAGWEGTPSRHLLFLDQLPVEAIASRLPRLNIRSSDRLHVAAERDPRAICELVHRLIAGVVHRDAVPRIVDAWLESDQLTVLAPTFERLEIPLNKLAKHVGTDRQEIKSFQIDEDGRFLFWPHADVHLGWPQLLEIVDPTSALAEKRKSKQFNQRYGAAIRSLREERELKQSDMGGVTERHLRRIEYGQQAASKRVLESLAQAHEMALEEYLQALAKRLGKRA